MYTKRQNGRVLREENTVLYQNGEVMMCALLCVRWHRKTNSQYLTMISFQCVWKRRSIIVSPSYQHHFFISITYSRQTKMHDTL
jgi:predicted membrane-bound mannosyltransferase